MKKIVFFSILIIALVGYVCYHFLIPINRPGTSGYIMKLDGARALVVETAPHESGIYEATWVRIPFIKRIPGILYVGQMVAVDIFGGTDTSYPAQAAAKKIMVLDTDHPNEAVLAQDQVVQAAVNNVADFENWKAIKAISFNQEKAVWELQIVDGSELNKKVIHVNVSDNEEKHVEIVDAKKE
ncbi:DUF3221 domain-containing protein [Bacillaceae bacterium Marseille-Q3522]|nr:DUF3221 domain-containing protein [Bacillaceae bacterium Marseille-Q3522]